MYNVDLMREKETKELLILLKEAFILNENGQIIWNRNRPITHFKTVRGYNGWVSNDSNNLPGTRHKSGYFSLSFSFQGDVFRILYHRAVFALTYDRWPIDLLDHKDGDTSNNALENLEESNKVDNNRNQPLRRNSKWGILGVTWDDFNGKWRAAGGDGRKFVHLGRTGDFFEACCLRKSWEAKQGYSINHGRRAA